MENLISKARAEARSNSLHNEITGLIERAKVAQPYAPFGQDGYGQPRGMRRQPAAAMTTINLREAQLSSLFDKDGKLRRVPNATLAANSVTLDTAIIANSRIAEAGASVIVYREMDKAHPTGPAGALAIERRPGSLRSVEAGKFAVVADDGDALTSAFPIKAADIEITDSPSRALRFEFTRREQKSVTPDIFGAEIAAAVTLGVARAADEILLTALAAAGLADFSLASVAAKGLGFSDLRALIGTAANGAAIGADGVLRAGGIAGTLTSEMAGTIVGAWDRTAVAIHEDLPVMFERTNLNGKLVVTAWLNAVAVIPDKTFLFNVPAAP